jgi:hypothetical protein
MEVRAQILDPTALTFGKTNGILRMGGWPGPKTGHNSSYKIKTSWNCRESIHDYSTVQQQPSHYFHPLYLKLKIW